MINDVAAPTGHLASHIDVTLNQSHSAQWKSCSRLIGVDSGKASIPSARIVITHDW